MLRRRNKKGSAQDLILIAVLLVFFGVVTLIGFKVSSEFVSQAAEVDVVANDTYALQNANELNAFYPGVIDNMFLFLVIGLAMTAIVLAALVRIHPIFIPLFIIAWIFVIFLSGILSNIYQTMAENALLQPQADQLTFISNILNVLPFIIGVFGILLMVVLYKLGNFSGS